MTQWYRWRLLRLFACTLLILLSSAVTSPLLGSGPAAQTSGPKIWLQDSQPLPMYYGGRRMSSTVLLQATSAQPAPLAMASADVDGDGISDLLVGYDAGFIAVHRGNLDAFAPQSDASFQAIARNQFSPPFLPDVKTFAVPVRPDFIAIGNFTADGNQDLAVASKGGDALYVFAGDGKGNFAAAQTINLPGALTALTADNFGNAGQFSTLIVAVSGQPQEPFSLLVYCGSQQGLTPLAGYALPAPASAITFGNLDGDAQPDAAILAGDQVLVLHGATAQLEPISLPVSVSAMALGSFIFDRDGRVQIALLTSDGAIHIAVHDSFDPHKFTAQENVLMRQEVLLGEPNTVVPPPANLNESWKIVESFPGIAPFAAGQPPLVFRTRISGNSADDVMVLSSSLGQMLLISHPNLADGAPTFLPGQVSTRPYSGSPVAALATRVNIDGRPGVVTLHQGEMAPRFMGPLPDPIFTVNTTADLVSAIPNACAAAVPGQCSLRQAITEANNAAGPDTIMVPAGVYLLTIGNLSAGGENANASGDLDILDGVTIVGAPLDINGNPRTVIEAGTSGPSGIDKVFSVNPNFNVAFNTSFSNLEIRFGFNKASFSGDGFGGGFDWEASGTGNMTVTNCFIHDNQTTDGEGGGITATNQIGGAGLFTISNSTISNNVARRAPAGAAGIGGGIFIGQHTATHITNTKILNNQIPQANGIGGGIGIIGPSSASGGQTTIHASAITGNTSAGTGGGINTGAGILIDQGTIISNNTATGDGGGLWNNDGNPETTTLSHVTITGNHAGGHGGGIRVDTATPNNLNITLSRLASNTASAGGSNLSNAAGAVTASENWWGTNSPGSTIEALGGITTSSPFVVFALAASPNKIGSNQTSTLTASFLKDSTNAVLATSQIDQLLGVPITFGNAVLGTISAAQPAIQATGSGAGTATATYNAGSTAGQGSADATVDEATLTANITVVGPPTIGKAFNPTSIALNTSSVLSFNLANPNTTTALSGVAFNDTLPAGLVVAATPNVTGSCGSGTITAAAGSATISLSGGTLAASPGPGSSCSFSVSVTGTTIGPKNNVTGTVTSTEGGTGGTALATLNVDGPPTVSKAFGAPNIPVNGTTSLTFTLTNPGANPDTLTGIAFTDSLQGGLVVASPNGLAGSCLTAGGSVTAVAGSTSIGLTGLALTSGGTCTFTVNVTGTLVGINIPNTTGAVTSTNGGTGAPSNTATLTVANPATHFAVSTPASATAGTAFSFTVTALDQFNNTATGYAGAVHFSSSDGSASLPANSVLTNGVGTFPATLKTVGSQTITATDTVTASITGTSNAIAVSPAAATHFALSAPASATAGTAISVTVTALDQFNNTATGYAGTVHFTSSDGSASLPANSALTNGVATFSATLKTAGSQTITATDAVTASITGPSNAIAVSAAAATHFALSAPSSATAGTAFNFTVTALDQFNNTAAGYAGTVHFSSGDGSASLPANSALTNGFGTFSLTLKTAGSQTVTATDAVTASITGTSNAIAVSAAAATHFALSAPASATAGTAFSFTVTALDQFNNTATGYTGTVHFSSSDGSASLPANSTLTNGVGTFSATLKTAGSQTVTATDTVTNSITGTFSAIAVSPAAATHFMVTASASATAGTAFNFTVTALDQFNNTAADYAGTVHFTSSDGSASLPANSALTNGVGTFSATLKTAGSQTTTATDTGNASITGTSNAIAVSAAPATHFALSAPSSATAGTAFNFTVTALDQFNNTAAGYAGTVHFTSSDAAASLPANSTLTNGVGTFSATLKTAGSQTITATDTGNASITGTSNTIVVSAAPATHFALSAPASATAGTAFSFTVAALDQFNNAATGYAGTVHFSSPDGSASLPANSVLTNGVGTFSATLKTVGSQTITATDTGNASITGTSNPIAVSSAAATHLRVSASSSATAGTAINVTVTALDQFNNTATSYAGTVHFSSSDGSASLPADSALTNGVATFSATLKTAGSQTITATDTVTASITGTSNAIAVTAAPATHFALSAPSSATAGTAFNFTVTALDQFNNAATGYAGTAHFTSSDGSASLPANSALTNGVGTFSATLKTAGSQTVTATDTGNASITGTSNPIAVSSAAATHFALSAPSSATAGTAFNFTVTALDQFNNTATGYAGTVHFSSSDGSASLPANSTLTNGVGTFSVTLKTLGIQTITGTDTVNTPITGTSSAITVSAPPATHFAVSAASAAAGGVPFSFTVTALDRFNNTATAYAGTVHFTSSDAAASLPPDATLTNGVGTFSATLRTPGSQTVAAIDTVNTSITGTSNTITVRGATLSIAKAHVGQFHFGQNGAQYTLTVSNLPGAGSTVGPVTVVDTLPVVSSVHNLVPVSLNGAGWTCDLPSLSCTRSDALPPGASYPVITLTVNIPTDIQNHFTNTATVSGGGDPVSHTGADPVTLGSSIVITSTDSGSATVTAGSSATFNFAVDATAVNPPPVVVAFTCDGLPRGAACLFTPLAEGQVQSQLTMTVTTLGHGSAGIVWPFAKPGAPLYAVLLLPLLGLVYARRSALRGKTRILLPALSLAGLMLLLALAGCGGSPMVTPPGTYTITVTGNADTSPGPASGSTTVTLNVQ